jgi:hypothetical protein
MTPVLARGPERDLQLSSRGALSLAVASTGSVRLATTPLLTAEEMDRASQKKTAYKGPGA